jgi:putative oxidoreductase
MLSGIETLGVLMLVTPYLWSAILYKPRNYRQVLGQLADKGFPAPALMYVGAILLEVGGSIVLLLPTGARPSWLFLTVASCFAGFTMLSAVCFHNFWSFKGNERLGELVNFVKNIGLTGAFVLLAVRFL